MQPTLKCAATGKPHSRTSPAMQLSIASTPPSLRVSTVTHAGVWTNTRSVCGLLIISAHGLFHETVCLQALRYSLKTRARQFTLRTVLSLFSSYLVVLAVDPFSATRFAYFPTATKHVKYLPNLHVPAYTWLLEQ